MYASVPENLNAAVETAKSIEAGYKITQRNVQQQSNHALQQLPQKDSMEVLIATIEKLLRQKEEERYPTT